MSTVPSWSTAAGGNNATPPDGFPEGMGQNTFNNSCREVMASVRTWYDDPEWLNLMAGFVGDKESANVFRITGVDHTAYYVTGSRVKIVGATTIEGFVTSATFSAGNTHITVDVTVPTSAVTIYRYLGKTLRKAAFIATGTAVGEIPVNTSAAALGTAAYKNQSNTTGDVPVHSQTGPLKSGTYHDFPTRTFVQGAGTDQTYTASAEIAITGLGNITIPGTPDGAKKYKVSLFVHFDVGPDIVVTCRIRVGTNGNLSDATAFTLLHTTSNVSGAEPCTVAIPSFEITPAASTKVTCSFESSGSGTIFLGTTAGKTSFVEVQEIAA